MSARPVALILGAGPRIGTSVAAKFVANGYNVAVVSRKGGKADEGVLSLKADFTKPESIAEVFEKVETEFQAAPSVVIYNAAALTPPPSQDSMFSIPADKFGLDLNVNTVSPYVAAQKAVIGWETLPKDTKKTFIYTGNAQNVSMLPIPMMLNLGVGKSASSYWIDMADTLYSAKGYR
jgi:NAD(P)-dependent dehydrogenase (short-subunit alcohol dehydrogenase family)